jgi:hypothetical protein
MKKIFFILIIVSFGFIFLNAQDKIETTVTENKVVNSGFEKYLKQYIDNEVAVYIIAHDITFFGTLLEVYDDGIVIKPAFRDPLFITKQSISYVEVKKKKINK